jgi:hypothetical protein
MEDTHSSKSCRICSTVLPPPLVSVMSVYKNVLIWSGEDVSDRTRRGPERRITLSESSARNKSHAAAPWRPFASVDDHNMTLTAAIEDRG